MPAPYVYMYMLMCHGAGLRWERTVWPSRQPSRRDNPTGALALGAPGATLCLLVRQYDPSVVLETLLSEGAMTGHARHRAVHTLRIAPRRCTLAVCCYQASVVQSSCHSGSGFTFHVLKCTCTACGYFTM
jgi:hypothetical protein